MFRDKSRTGGERIIVDGRIIDVATLRQEARRAGTRFWVLLVLISIVSSMVVPYISMASIVAEGTRVFDSTMVIPGYSMGGIDITAYGVDINEWGKTATQSASNPRIVQSTYGYWTKDRAEDASKNLVASQKADKDDTGAPLNDFSVSNDMLDADHKGRGWLGITRKDGEGEGLVDFQANPSGATGSRRGSYNEAVAPYRTQEDWRYWDDMTVGGADPTMTATLYPDFVVLGWNEKTQTARVLGNPDSTENATSAGDDGKSAGTGAIQGTMAVPRYVPVSTLFEAYGLDKSVMGDDGMNDMDALLDAIGKDASQHGGKATKLNEIVKKSTDAKNNLLVGTHYENLNGSNKSQDPSSDAWNPYPYSMVFSAESGNGRVVSSIYNNTEAYVYFSPYSVYGNYMTLRAEYDSLVNSHASLVASEDPQIAFQLGYYLAGMSILEAYLNEALPQDMTRGYVGPAEGNPLATSSKSLTNEKKLNTRSGDSGTVSALFKDSLGTVDSGDKALGFKSVSYSQLMYDFADSAIVRHGQGGDKSRLGMTSAIMNTLSTYGYGTKDQGNDVNTESKSAGQGPNRGMTRKQAMARVTAYGPYGNSASTLSVSMKDKWDPLLHPDSTGKENTGLYVPVYHPIQQHEMPISEMAYRFQVIADIPYETLTHELATHGFNRNVTLSYKNNAIEDLAQTKNYYNKNASLSQQLNEIDEATDGSSLGEYDASESILTNPDKQAAMVGEQTTKSFADEKDLTTRVDNAFLAFKQGRMNADNVHDLVDIVRAIPGAKYETFMRYYNPLKSSGGADDIYLTRVTPAMTPYMPKMLMSGYECAGGTTNNSNIVSTANANFDYFSIPSLAPCIAAKTAETTYYGSLNYELRPFYTKGFLSSLPANSNVPALERYEASKSKDEEEDSDSGDGEEGEDEEEEEPTSITDIKDKVTTIYVLGKRLAFAMGYGKLMDAQNGSEGAVSLGALNSAGLQSSIVASKNKDAIKAALAPKDAKGYKNALADNGQDGIVKRHGALNAATSAITGIISVLTGGAARGYQVASGDLLAATGSGTGQATAYYDQGNGSATAVSYAKVGDQWVPQAASEGTAAPGALGSGSGARDATNGLPVMQAESIPTLPPANLANGSPGATTNPADNAKAATKTEEKTEDDTESKQSDQNSNASGSASASSSPSSSSSGSKQAEDKKPVKTEPVAEDNGPYADNGGEADQIYIKDKLAAKGFLKASTSQWQEAKGTRGIGETITFHIPSGMKFSNEGGFDYVMQKFGQKHIIPDETLTKKTIWCKDSNGYAFVTDVKTVMSALYEDAYSSVLMPGTTYYWDSAKSIASWGGGADRIEAKDDEKVDYNTVAMDYAQSGNASAATEAIDEYCKDAFGDAADVWRNMKALNDELPQQMQNVLAWADSQTVSESESNYMADSTEANLIITIGNRKVETPSIGVIRSLADLESADFELYRSDGDWEAVPKLGTEEQNDDLQSRMTQGVTGIVATATGSLSAYAMSSVIGRTNSLVTSNSSQASVPYAGIWSGSLTAGTDRYAELQAHRIDHEGISSRMSGDLRSRAKVGTDVAVASSTTDARTQQAIGKTANLADEFMYSTVPASMDIASEAVSTIVSGSGSGKTLRSDSDQAHAADLFGAGSTKQSMAMASTFDTVTMNRKSAASQQAVASTGRLEQRGSLLPTASADESDGSVGSVTRNKEMAKMLVDGSLSDFYAAIQSIALIMVLAFLMVIAFQNFVGYTSGREKDYIDAQTRLKTVLPRALIAVAMIGLPPLGGGVGFQGGCFLLLQVVSALTSSVLSVLLQGTSPQGFIDRVSNLVFYPPQLPDSAWDIVKDFISFMSGKQTVFDVLIALLSAAIFMVASVIITVLVTIIDLFLLLFWIVGPVMWAFYVWPYSEKDKAPSTGIMGKIMGNLTGKMGSKIVSGKSVGKDAPGGWLMGYLSTLGALVAWNVMFWVGDMVLDKIAPASSAAVQELNKYQTGGELSEDLTHIETSASGIMTVSHMDSAGDLVNSMQNIWVSPMGRLLGAILFLGMTILMFKILKKFLGGAAGAALRGISGAINAVKQVAHQGVTGLATLNKAERDEQLKNGFLTKHFSDSQRERLSKWMTSDTAVHIGNMARATEKAKGDIKRAAGAVSDGRVGDALDTLRGADLLRPLHSGMDEPQDRDGTLWESHSLDGGRSASAATATGREIAGHVPAIPGQVLGTNADRLVGKAEAAEQRIAELKAADSEYFDLQQLDALSSADPRCMSRNGLDARGYSNNTMELYAKMEKAEAAGKTGEAKKLRKQVDERLAVLEPTSGGQKVSAETLAAMGSDAERQKALLSASVATHNKFFATARADGSHQAAYASVLAKDREGIDDRHARRLEAIEANAAIRDSANNQAAAMLDDAYIKEENPVTAEYGHERSRTLVRGTDPNGQGEARSNGASNAAITTAAVAMTGVLPGAAIGAGIAAARRFASNGSGGGSGANGGNEPPNAQWEPIGGDADGGDTGLPASGGSGGGTAQPGQGTQ